MSVAASFHLAAFHHFFRVIHADTPALRNVCYRLRHKVYCEEFGFEPIRSDGLESDEWDSKSIHCLVQNVVNEEFVACARLVIPTHHSRMTLPFQRVCKASTKTGDFPDADVPLNSVAEVSRLAIVSDYRGRSRSSKGSRHNKSIDHPPVLAGLLLGLLALGRQHGMKIAYLLAEPRLIRYLTTFMGFRPRVMTDPVQHHGTRLLAMLNVYEMLTALSRVSQSVFEEIANGLTANETEDLILQAGNLAVTTLSRPVRFA